MKIPKAKAIEAITEMRARGIPKAEICKRLGLGNSQVGRYITAYRIQKGLVCPHCSRDITRDP